jgi:hypothetical protein
MQNLGHARGDCRTKGETRHGTGYSRRLTLPSANAAHFDFTITADVSDALNSTQGRHSVTASFWVAEFGLRPECEMAS